MARGKTLMSNTARGAAKPRRKKAARIRGTNTCPVVGIGASAGGLEAFERFFAHMSTDSGLAFVLVPHLDAKHPSAMVDLVRRFTEMPVQEKIGRASCRERV